MKKGPRMAVMMALMIISLVFTIQGVSMHSAVGPAEDEFHALQTDYFTQSKAVRDGAETGSELNKQLAVIKNTPSNLLRLKLVGVGKILTGIFVLLFGILLALLMMPIHLGKVIKEHTAGKNT